MIHKAEDAEQREILHALMLSNTTLNKALAQQIQQPVVQVTPARSYIDRAFTIIPTFLMCATLLVTVGRSTGSTETSMEARLIQAQKDATRAQQNVLLLDTYNRELERAIMQAKTTIKLPSYPVLDK